jgi:hypothetical protein
MYLDESDVCCLLSKALTADVETILSDKTSLVSADSAEEMLVLPPIIYSAVPPALRSKETYHARAPFPYVRGLEFQTDS